MTYKLTFYSVSSVDGTPTETLVYSAISGDLQLDQSRAIRNEQNELLLTGYIFYPESYITGFSFGMKVTSSTVTYKVEGWEAFDDHVEVYLRKINA
jgi:hypothetical protein